MKHPSDAGLQIGRIYSRILTKLMPDTLQAVLVVGSNAVGMALPTSDVDLLVVRDHPKNEPPRGLRSDDPVIIAFKKLEEKLGTGFHIPSIISTEEFLKLKNPNYQPAFRFTKWAARQIRDAAIPVFVKKGFQVRCWSVLKAQRYKEKLPMILARYNAKAQTAERLALRQTWQKRTAPLIRK